MRCEQLTIRGAMAEARPCIRNAKHKGHHIPDLTDLKFGNTLVLRLGPGYIDNRGKSNTQWICRVAKREKIVRAGSLLSGKEKGLVTKLAYENGVVKPEYRTVENHYRWIFKDPKAITYKGMPFYEEWDPAKGGHFWKASEWIIDNLGRKSNRCLSLDIIEHSKGFVPGNLRWALRGVQTQNRQHKVLGRFSLEELRVEAKRHGYILVKEEFDATFQPTQQESISVPRRNR